MTRDANTVARSRLPRAWLLCLLAAWPVQQALASNGREWTALFNGRDLKGWRFVGDGYNEVRDGQIQTGVHGVGLLYWTGGKVGHCTIRVVFRMLHDTDNSGVFIRIPIEPHEDGMPVDYGYEVSIDNHPETSGEDDFHVTGTLYSLTKPKAIAGKPGPEWNTMDITLDGPRTTVVLNGALVTDFREGDRVPERKRDDEPVRGPRPDTGWIGLQSESFKDVVLFKQVLMRSLP